MAHSYTPGLRVTPHTVVRKLRRLPIAGQVLLENGVEVRAEDVVARAELPGNIAAVNVMNQLGVGAAEIRGFLLKEEGDSVNMGEVIAETRPFIRLFRSTVESPIAGTVETISDITGQVIMRAPPRPVDLSAYIDGRIVEVREKEGVVVETEGAFIQGILGVGGEVCGEICMAGGGREAVITPADLREDMRGKIVVAGAFVSSEVYKRASELGIIALICGGFNDSDLRDLLGRDLGVAITGHEEISPIIIITEGFGHIPMAQATYTLLATHEGDRASASGATQIRAGVMRPEIIIPHKGAAKAGAGEGEKESLGLQIGSRVRIVRDPRFGSLGVVKSLPMQPTQVESETTVRVVEITLDDGVTLTVPRSNVESIES